MRAWTLVAWMAWGILPLTLGCPSGTGTWRTLPPWPGECGVAGAFAGVSGESLIAAGGANFPRGLPWEGGPKTWQDAVYVLETPEGPWRLAGRLPRPAAYGVSFTTPEGMVCAGGSTPGACLPTVLRLSWRGGRLCQDALPPLPTPLANACGVCIGTTLYMAGGEASDGATAASSAFLALDLTAMDRGWQALPSWPGPARSLAAAAAQGGRFLLMGGVSLAPDAEGKPRRTYLRDAYAFEPRSRAWTRLADLPFPAAAAPTPAPVTSERYVLLAGCDDGSRYLRQPPQAHPGFCATPLVYDAQQNRWHTLPALPFPAAVTLPTTAWREGQVFLSGEVRPGVRTRRLGFLHPARPQ